MSARSMERALRQQRAQRRKTVTVRVECVQCKARKDVEPGDVEPGMVPFCDRCFMPMATISASVR